MLADRVAVAFLIGGDEAAHEILEAGETLPRYDTGGRIVSAECPEAAGAVAAHIVQQLLAMVNARLQCVAREAERVVVNELMVMLAAIDGHIGRGADDTAARAHADARAEIG